MVATGRRRGRRPLLSRERIVAAARTLPPESLTMKAVAEVLGVDRKSLNYHVIDRDGLLELIAFDAFEREVALVDLDRDADWRELLRVFTTSVAQALIDVGVLIPTVRFTGKAGLTTLAVIERMIRSLMDAGFDEAQAGRTMKLLAEVAHSAAGEALEAVDDPIDPQAEHVLRTLDGTSGDAFPLLREAASTLRNRTQLGTQFAFELDLIISGLEQLLGSRRRRQMSAVDRVVQSPMS